MAEKHRDYSNYSTGYSHSLKQGADFQPEVESCSPDTHKHISKSDGMCESDENDNTAYKPEIGRDLCRLNVKTYSKSGALRTYHGGYRKDILAENLTEKEKTDLICDVCEGIMKDACILSDIAERYCWCCEDDTCDFDRDESEGAVRATINLLKCSCPLIKRGCKWIGILENCENHLDTCGYVYERCQLKCGVVLERDKLKVHEKEKCTQRVIKCNHCKEDFLSCELDEHLNMKVSCDLKCGEMICRKDMTEHLKNYCLEKQIECPFAKYKCLAIIRRKDFDKHLEEKETKHLGLKLAAMEDLIIKQSEEIKKLNENIEKQSKEINSKNKEIWTEIAYTSQLTYLLYSTTDTTKIIWKIEDVTGLMKDCNSLELKQCEVVGYSFRFKFRSNGEISMVFPETTVKYGKPFIAKCHIALSCHNSIDCGIIEVKRKDLIRGCERIITSISQRDIEKSSETKFPGDTKRDLILVIAVTLQ